MCRGRSPNVSRETILGISLPDKQLVLIAFGLARPLVAAFLKEMGEETNPTRMGIEVSKDPALIHSLLQGREIRIKTAERIVAFIEQHRRGFTREFCAQRLAEVGND